MKNCISRIIQGTWKNYMKCIAPNGPKGLISIERDERRFRTVTSGITYFMKETLEERAKKMLLVFLRDKFKMLNFQLKIRANLMKVYAI